MTMNRKTGVLAGFFKTWGSSPQKVEYHTGWLDQFFQFFKAEPMMFQTKIFLLLAIFSPAG
jgi:hypothetical protein